jgi:hypothetical protein
MTDQHRRSLQQKSILATLLASGCSVSLFAVVVVCLIAGCAAIFIINTIEESELVTVVETEVPIDTTVLREDPSIQNWYSIALQVLRSSGWELSRDPVLLGGGVSCSSPLDLTKLHLEFAATDFVGILPHGKAATVDLNRATEKASIGIYDAGLRLRHSQHMELSKMAVGLYDAFEIADENGGQDFRESTNNNCDVTFWITDYEWQFDYREFDHSTRAGLRIQVDARSGKVRQLPQ